MTVPGVAVIIPVRNKAQFIERCIASVADEKAVSTILIWNDASTDGSVRQIRQFGSSKIELFESSESIGAARARHALIERCATDYLFFLDGDDFLEAGTVDRGLEAALAHGWDLTIARMIKTDLDGRQLATFVERPDRPMRGIDAFEQTLGTWNMHAMGVLRRASYASAADGFDFHGFTSDEVLTRRILLACATVGGADGTYFYRRDDKPISLEGQLASLRSDVAVLEMTATQGARFRDSCKSQFDRILRTAIRLRLHGIATDRLTTALHPLGAALPFADFPLRNSLLRTVLLAGRIGARVWS